MRAHKHAHSSAQRFDGSRDEPRQAVFRACIVDGFKCGQEGHMSRDYPNSDSLSGGGGRGCFKFGFELSRYCPTASSDDRPKNGYFNCGEYNHMSRDCPNPQHERRSKEWFKCAEKRHMSWDCPNPHARGGRGGNSSGEGGDRPKGCFKWQQEGHMAKDCTNEPVPRMGPDGGVHASHSALATE
ncbi:uncharacterized protein LOC142776324 isoform X3 [Rhipicephalus microplus]|uniref:uncharacterized protein LOC142776324 isoform X3 n=1 Tax=Rhipicephalus microplus TaxID=6941 RepID=UPI003F6B7166